MPPPGSPRALAREPQIEAFIEAYNAARGRGFDRLAAVAAPSSSRSLAGAPGTGVQDTAALKELLEEVLDRRLTALEDRLQTALRRATRDRSRTESSSADGGGGGGCAVSFQDERRSSRVSVFDNGDVQKEGRGGIPRKSYVGVREELKYSDQEGWRKDHRNRRSARLGEAEPGRLEHNHSSLLDKASSLIALDGLGSGAGGGHHHERRPYVNVVDAAEPFVSRADQEDDDERRDSAADSAGPAQRQSRKRKTVKKLFFGDRTMAERDRVRQPDDGSLQERLRRYLDSPNFTTLTTSLIVANSLLIGIETDYLARNRTFEEKDHAYIFPIAESAMCCLFVLEIALQVWSHGAAWFRGPLWRWNLFDLSVVSLQVIEEIHKIPHLLPEAVTDVVGIHLGGFALLRMMRIFRIVRLLRGVDELRMLLTSIATSVRSLGWTILTLTLFTYIFGVFLTQIATNYQIDHTATEDGSKALSKYFGSLDRSMISLYASITGGISWHEVMDPLAIYCSPWLQIGFVLYIAFAVLAMMNILTGLFVESALRVAKDDKNNSVVEKLEQMFDEMDEDNSGYINFKEFEQALSHNGDMLLYLNALEIDEDSARMLFCLLDEDGSGEIDCAEFLHGLLRLQGNAKAIDFAAFMNEWRWLSQRLEAHMELIEGKPLEGKPYV